MADRRCSTPASSTRRTWRAATARVGARRGVPEAVKWCASNSRARIRRAIPRPTRLSVAPRRTRYVPWAQPPFYANVDEQTLMNDCVRSSIANKSSYAQATAACRSGTRRNDCDDAHQQRFHWKRTPGSHRAIMPRNSLRNSLTACPSSRLSTGTRCSAGSRARCARAPAAASWRRRCGSTACATRRRSPPPAPSGRCTRRLHPPRPPPRSPSRRRGSSCRFRRRPRRDRSAAALRSTLSHRRQRLRRHAAAGKPSACRWPTCGCQRRGGTATEPHS